MKKKSFPTILFASLITVSTSLYAENTLDGYYIGLDLSSLTGDDEGSKKVSGVSDRFDFEAKPKGYGLGLTLGYDAIFSDHFLMGIELAGFGYNVDETTTPINYNNDPPTLTTCTYITDLKYKFEAKLKAGYTFNEKKSSIYVTGGYSAAKIDRTYTTVSSGNFTNDDWNQGYVLGIGTEHLLSDKLALKIEHTHSSYGTEDINTNAAWANSVQEIDFYDDTTHIGLQYRF